jgi:predicted permease
MFAFRFGVVLHLKIHWIISCYFPLEWHGLGLWFLYCFGFRKCMVGLKKLTGCLILTAGLGNTSSLGFLLKHYTVKKEWNSHISEPGTFVVLSTLGILVATMYPRGAKWYPDFKKIMLFPPFITFIVACLMNVFNFDFHEWIQFILQK